VSPDARFEPATTYYEAVSRYPCLSAARERFDELTTRELSVRAFAKLKARGEYDPARHGDAGKYEPLTTAEHVEILAAGEVLARYYRHPARVDEALNGGATWEQMAEASGTSPGQAREDYRSWAEGQHRLWADYEGKFGMDDADYAAALDRAEAPAMTHEATREPQMEAGQ
jgi:hypothetical protein